MKVIKFGGSSLANAGQIKKAGRIVLDDKDRKIVVVSAPGKRNSEDIKVTDLLINLSERVLAGQSYQEELSLVVERFSTIISDLKLDSQLARDIEDDLQARIDARIADNQSTATFMDLMKAAGEDNCARMFAAYLLALGKDAKYMNPGDAGMILSDEFGNARVLPQTYENLKKLADTDSTIVFPGFFAYTEDGRVVTFSRGGSDITGSILAASVDAKVYENWTDVDAVYAINPSLIDNPYPIKEITYDEMRELAYAGFEILHEEALMPTFLKSIPIQIKNTNNPDSPGTKIVATRKSFEGMVTGVAGAKGFVNINISRYLMNREVGFVVKVLKIFAEENIPFEHMPSGIDSISIIIRGHYWNKKKEESILQKLRDRLDIHNVEVRYELALVMIVGEAMAKTVGVTARAASCLSRAGINLEIIDQGASEKSIIFGIRDELCDYALKELYKEFFER